MRSFLVTIAISTVLASGLLAQEAPPERISCGRTLFVVAADPYIVTVDGVERGTTPLLLWNLDAGASVIEVRYGGRSARLLAQVSAAMPDVAHWYPTFPEQPVSFAPKKAAEALPSDGLGSLTITTGVKEQAVACFVDGVLADTGTALSLTAGIHVVMVSASGRLPSYSLVAIQPGDSISVPVEFSPNPIKSVRTAKSARIIAIAGGLAGSIAGFLIAGDDIAIDLSGGDYESYKTIKYAGYGTICGGLAIAAVSLLTGMTP